MKRWFVQCPLCHQASPSTTHDEAMRWASTHVCSEPAVDEPPLA